MGKWGDRPFPAYIDPGGDRLGGGGGGGGTDHDNMNGLRGTICVAKNGPGRLPMSEING